MKKIIFLFAVMINLFLSSCLNVFQPLITPDQYQHYPQLEGNWKVGDQVVNITEYSKSPLAKEQILSPGSEKKTLKDLEDSLQLYHRTYILSFSDKFYTYYFQAQIAKFDAGSYLQILPILFTNASGLVQKITEEIVPNTRFNAFGEGVISTYAFAKINITSPGKMNLRFIDGEKVKQLILAGQLKSPYVFDKLYDNFLITANSDALFKMVNKYGNHDEFYDKEKAFTFIKVN